MEAVVYRLGEGERHTAGSSEIMVKATGAETAGTFFLSESTIAPGVPGAPPHYHERLVDMFYVSAWKDSSPATSSDERSAREGRHPR
jgi:hypothetical protein